MSRYTFVLAAVVSLTGLSSGGCRSCSSCHDYDPPCSHCNCGCSAPCGCNGCGSSGCGCSGGGCSTCNSCPSAPCGCNQPHNAYPGSAPVSPDDMSPAYASKIPSDQLQQPEQLPPTTNASQQ